MKMAVLVECGSRSQSGDQFDEQSPLTVGIFPDKQKPTSCPARGKIFIDIIDNQSFPAPERAECRVTRKFHPTGVEDPLPVESINISLLMEARI